VTESRIDKERLAALIDGRLSASDRAAVLKELAASDPDTFAAIVDAAAVADDLAGNSEKRSAVSPLSISRSRKRPYRIAVGTAIAAGLIAVVAIPRATRRDRQMPDFRTDFASMLTAPSFPALTPASGTARGSADAKSDTAGAFRMGGLLTDLRLGSRGSMRRRDVAMDLSELLRDTGQPAVSTLFAGIAVAPDGAATASDSAIATAVRMVSPAGPESAVAAGAWIEAARFAAATADEQFFNRTDHVSTNLGTLTDARAPGSAKRIRRLIGVRGWNDLARELESLQRTMIR
jgi:hypothetical protein